MSKVYMAFLGTNDYLACTYFSDDREMRDVRFVQEATLEFFCNDWSKDDRILIFTTDEVVQKNWKDNGHRDRETGKYFKRNGLKKCIKDLNLSTPFQNVPIPEGKSEQEIWDIFKIVLDQLSQGDEVVFDITHAFRSIPMLAIVVLNYAKIMKKITLHGIYYGAFEVLGTIPEAKKIPLKERRVPILDLTSFDQLMEWSLAINRFIEAGDAAHISRLANQSARSFLSKTKGKDRSAHFLRRIAGDLDKFTKTLSTCRGLDISNVVNKLNKDIRQLEESNYLPPEPFQPVFKQIKEQISLFKGDSVMDGISAVRWCLDHNLIQQGYTILRETLISHFVSKIGENPRYLKNKNRQIVNQAVTIYANNLSRKEWIKPAKDDPETTRKFIKYFKTQKELVKIYNDLSDSRNDLNHAGYRTNARRSEIFGKQLSEMIVRIETCLADGS
ncbi:MAG: TIGR02221 family CRISPR-associated protein [Deltaproteobacteria bacterium]|nr:TIGR02221 family CRISPR-associated protein [Deltaproteobacteria bacterium]MBW2034173.1 TIGR02221 family CRISPR-associated protein [Deltaproteobacteria bacterium]